MQPTLQSSWRYLKPLAAPTAIFRRDCKSRREESVPVNHRMFAHKKLSTGKAPLITKTIQNDRKMEP